MKFPGPEGDHYDPSVVYVHQASHTRGVLINQIILLERLIDSYISKYFCDSQDKATELMDMILATRRMSFDGKAEVFRAILDKLHPEKKKENSATAKDLKFIIEERNMLAHYFLDVSPDILNNFSETNLTFTLLKIEKTRTKEIYDSKRIIKIGDTTVHYINAINEML